MAVPPGLIPPLNLNLASSLSSDARSSSPFDASGFSVTIGRGQVPTWVWAAGLVLAAVFIWRRGR